MSVEVIAETIYLAFNKYSRTASTTQRVTRRGFDASATRAGVQRRTDEKCVLRRKTAHP
jgi:hypothetical protein